MRVGESGHLEAAQPPEAPNDARRPAMHRRADAANHSEGLRRDGFLCGLASDGTFARRRRRIPLARAMHVQAPSALGPALRPNFRAVLIRTFRRLQRQASLHLLCFILASSFDFKLRFLFVLVLYFNTATGPPRATALL